MSLPRGGVFGFDEIDLRYETRAEEMPGLVKRHNKIVNTTKLGKTLAFDFAPARLAA